MLGVTSLKSQMSLLETLSFLYFGALCNLFYFISIFLVQVTRGQIFKSKSQGSREVKVIKESFVIVL